MVFTITNSFWVEFILDYIIMKIKNLFANVLRGENNWNSWFLVILYSQLLNK